MLNRSDLRDMLSYKRPARSKSEEQFIKKYIDVIPDVFEDNYGNRILYRPDSKIMISCHTDTVHREPGRQYVEYTNGIAHLPKNTKSNCLGADDTAGIYTAIRMIQAGVQATFVFHRDEEIGGRGSSWLADNYPEWLAKFDICLALDRRGKFDIITSQIGGKCASKEFAASLALALDMGHEATDGIFTDSANYTHLIQECSNISIGYQNEHSSRETLDLDYLDAVADRLLTVDWTSLTVSRDTADTFDDSIMSYSWYRPRERSLNVMTLDDDWYDYGKCEYCYVEERLTFYEGSMLCAHCHNFFTYDDIIVDLEDDDDEGEDSPPLNMKAVY